MDMYNWDMVCAVSCRDLNKELKKSVRNNFGEFSWADGAGNRISGMFDRWEIVPGGDVQRLNLITPLITGKLEASVLGKDMNVAVDNLCPKLQVVLAFVSGENGDDTHLKFNCRRISTSSTETASEGSVVILENDINNPLADRDNIVPALFCALMAKMIVARRNDLKFIFAEILTIPATSEVSWMKLHLLRYAYNEKISGELGCLAVLGILRSNSFPPHPDELQPVFDSSLVRDDGNSGFMLSRQVFMKNVVLPALPTVFKGAEISQFYLADGNVIRNSGNISLSPINGYTPYFNHFEMEVVDLRIMLNNARGRCDVVRNSSYVSFDLSAAYIPQLSVVNGVCKVNLVCATRPVFNSQGYDTAAQIFWIFGGWVVDALIQGIRSQMEHLLFEFGNRGISFDIYPIKFSSASEYTECGLAENFFMRN
ncbi:TULIP family P47-like protein [Erwinia amylovora]|uniref:TULIP family P47-like protein n=1 Tax=Erwinia amylovora TaxID=552 RepID=UPI0039BC4818